MTSPKLITLQKHTSSLTTIAATSELIIMMDRSYNNNSMFNKSEFVLTKTLNLP
jgi:hypothetical protein